ncbi:MAG TPA: hypothetical protein DD734_04690 [Firmicutes bacterium]|nr:hypothetical protein [Bacillota bacterium]
MRTIKDEQSFLLKSNNNAKSPNKASVESWEVKKLWNRTFMAIVFPNQGEGKIGLKGQMMTSTHPGISFCGGNKR